MPTDFSPSHVTFQCWHFMKDLRLWLNQKNKKLDMAFLVAQLVKICLQFGRSGFDPCWEDPLEKGKATHSSILVWKIPWTL